MKSLVSFSILASLTLSSLAAHAMPTSQEVYRNDDLRVVFYKDSNDPGVVWYLPMLKLYTDDKGQTKARKRKRADGKFDYTFYIVPYIPSDVLDYVASELPAVI